jgi:hypothetical protein
MDCGDPRPHGKGQPTLDPSWNCHRSALELAHDPRPTLALAGTTASRFIRAVELEPVRIDPKPFRVLLPQPPFDPSVLSEHHGRRVFSRDACNQFVPIRQRNLEERVAEPFAVGQLESQLRMRRNRLTDLRLVLGDEDDPPPALMADFAQPPFPFGGVVLPPLRTKQVTFVENEVVAVGQLAELPRAVAAVLPGDELLARQEHESLSDLLRLDAELFGHVLGHLIDRERQIRNHLAGRGLEPVDHVARQ